MKKLLPILAVSMGLAQIAVAQYQPALLGDPPDGSAPPAPIPRVVALKPAEILETMVENQGGRKIIVQHLALDPENPVKPVVPKVPAPVAPVISDAVRDEAAASFRLILLSATVFPGPATRLTWTHYTGDGTALNITGWSNIDWNHLTGINTFLGTDGEPHSFIMGINTEVKPLPDPPEFQTTSPTFLPDQENIPAEALLAVDSLHKIYAVEKEKLAAAHAGRERAAAARKAELLANPPQPKDLIIRYRIAETPLEVQGGVK